jgi:Cu-Zn family superoxide dismutase
MSKNQLIQCIAVFSSEFCKKGIKGFVKFSEVKTSETIKIELNIEGLPSNSSHGFHIHEAGDLTDKCTSMCAHFNPYNVDHGHQKNTTIKTRHVGDLGNIYTDHNGTAKYIFYDNLIKLRGTKCNIIGRGLIIHQDEDDLGEGGDAESLKTGNAGKRIACAVIGYSKDMFK